jgi:two-component system sensor histidine kinase RpfC
MEVSNKTHRLTPLQRLKARFEQRPDTEHEQSLVRVAIVVVVLVYLSGLALFGNSSESAQHGLLILSLFLIFSVTMIAAIAVTPGISITRRIICMFGDMGMITYLLYYYGEIMTPLYIVYLWVSSGYGLRYGNRYLAASTGMAAIGFYLVLTFNEDWRSDQTMGWGLWIGLIVLPMYIASLLAKLSRALNAAEAANRAKSRFLATMSHEIRTPINGIIGLLELLSKTSLAEKQQSLLQGAQSSAATLLHLIENVLDISKIEADQATLSHDTFDLHALINGVIGLFEYSANEKKLHLQRRIDPSCPYLLMGDDLRLRQVLVNLVGNAIKFTQKGKVELRVQADEQDEQQVVLRIQVTDTGIGISKEAQTRIFEPFRQEDERVTRRFGGTGLGMSIAKQLTELMGGQIEVSSVVGLGTTFTLRLPLERARQAPTKSPLRIPDGVRIVSRNQPVFIRLREFCARWGVACTVDLGISPSIPESVILIDAQLLDNAASFPLDQPQLASRDLVLLAEEAPAFDIWETGYSGVLTLPVDQERFYALLHGLQAANFDINEVEAEENDRPPQAIKPARILVADDNRINQEVTRSYLEQVGHKVTVVDDGQRALDALEKEPFDLAVVDMMMPGMGGLDVIRLYRHMVLNQDLPFIVLTANVADEARTLVESVGAKYMSKPLRGRTLQSVVQELLAEAQGPLVPADSEHMQESVDALIDEDIFQEIKTLLDSSVRLSKLVGQFCQDNEALLAQMRTMVKQQDWAGLSELAHALKGIALGIGAKQLGQAAEELELTMRQPDEPQRDDPLAAVYTAYRAVRDHLLARTAPPN